MKCVNLQEKGNPREVISRMVDVLQADLLVLGSRSQGGLRKYVTVPRVREMDERNEWGVLGEMEDYSFFSVGSLLEARLIIVYGMPIAASSSPRNPLERLFPTSESMLPSEVIVDGVKGRHQPKKINLLYF